MRSGPEISLRVGAQASGERGRRDGNAGAAGRRVGGEGKAGIQPFPNGFSTVVCHKPVLWLAKAGIEYEVVVRMQAWL